MQINVGILMSYDYEFLKQSLPLIYKNADKIVLALDENYNTWSGNKFEVDADFFDWISTFDVSNKIEIYKDNFYDQNLSSMENEVRERTMLSVYFGKKNWYIQLDSDELFINFKGFTETLKLNKKFLVHPEKNKVQLSLFWINLFKKVDGGYLYVSKPYEPFTCGTNFINYKTGRISHSRKKYLPFFVVHNTWARESDEIYFKLNNWGHNKDFDVESYFSFWKNISKENYKNFKNVHPVKGKKWKELSFCPGENLTDVVAYFEKSNKLKISPIYIFGKNISQKIKHFNL